jgi:hypothetical protein
LDDATDDALDHLASPLEGAVVVLALIPRLHGGGDNRVILDSVKEVLALLGRELRVWGQ